MQAAVLAHDAQLASAGITTVFDALTIADIHDNPVRAEMLHEAAQSVGALQRAGLFRAEHRLHMRCEVGNPSVVETAMLPSADVIGPASPGRRGPARAARRSSR